MSTSRGAYRSGRLRRFGQGGRHPRPWSGPHASRTRVSVLVLSYNYGRYLDACVRSILDQPGVDLDVLIVDDASTDCTPDVAERLAIADHRLRWVRNETNLGMIASLNHHIGSLQGDYVIKFDADDLMARGSLARAVALLESEPGVGFVYGRPLHFEGTPPTRVKTRLRGWTVWSGEEWIARLSQRAANVISQPEVVIRRRALEEAGPWNHALPHTSDLEMWLRIARHWEVGRVDGSVQGLYREHAQSMQRTEHAGLLVDLRGRLDAFESALGGSDRPSDQVALRTLRRRLARFALSQAARAIERRRQHLVDLDALVALAADADPSCSRSRAAATLKRRRRVAESGSGHHPGLTARAALRRLDEEIARAHWIRYGL